MAGDRLYRKKGGKVWYGYYYGSDGKRVYVCTKQQDRAAARAVLRELEREAHAAPGTRRARGETGHTVEQALGRFLELECADVAPATKAMYEHQSGHLKRLLGGIDVGRLTLDDGHESCSSGSRRARTARRCARSCVGCGARSRSRSSGGSCRSIRAG
jgi:hypothetical protein